MKQDEIEAYAYEVVYPDYDGELFYMLSRAKIRAVEVEGEIRKLYTEEQMQEYAKAKVLEALKKYGVQAEEWSEREAELAYKQMTKFIFADEEK